MRVRLSVLVRVRVRMLARVCACVRAHAPSIGMASPGFAMPYSCAWACCTFTVGLGLGQQRVRCVARLELFLATKPGMTPNHWTETWRRQRRPLGAASLLLHRYSSQSASLRYYSCSDCQARVSASSAIQDAARSVAIVLQAPVKSSKCSSARLIQPSRSGRLSNTAPRAHARGVRF